MSILRGSVTLSRFKIEDIPNNIPGRLKQFAFMPIDDIPEERAFGWTNFDDLLDTQWKQSIPEKDPFIVFSLRLDTRRIAPATLAKELKLAMEAEQERIKSLGKKFISRDRKKEIAELTKLRLLARTLPTPAYFEVVWEPSTGTIWLGSVSSKIQNMFCELFFRTFEVMPKLLTSYEMAASYVPEDSIDVLNSLTQSNFSQTQNTPDAPPIVEHVLSEEFLTWLLYRAWSGSSGFIFPHYTIRLEVHQPISVQDYNGETKSVVNVRGDNSKFAEIFKGLQESKKVCALTLQLEINDNLYSVRLSSPNALFLRGAKLPGVAKDSINDDPDGMFLERVYFIEELYGSLDVMFKKFVLLRISNDWKDEEERIREWVVKI